MLNRTEYLVDSLDLNQHTHGEMYPYVALGSFVTYLQWIARPEYLAEWSHQVILLAFWEFASPMGEDRFELPSQGLESCRIPDYPIHPLIVSFIKSLATGLRNRYRQCNEVCLPFYSHTVDRGVLRLPYAAPRI